MRRMGPALLARPHSHVRLAEEELESVVVAAGHGTAAHCRFARANGATWRMGPMLLARPHSHVRLAEEELESVVVAAGHGTVAHCRFARATQQPTAH